MVKEGSPRGAREQLLQAVRAASGPLAGHWVLVRALSIQEFSEWSEMCCGTEAGSYLRLIDSCITQLKAQGCYRTCNESKEEEKKVRALTPNHRRKAHPSMSDCPLCVGRWFNAYPYFPFSLVERKTSSPTFPTAPPWRQPIGKSMVSSVDSHTNATRIGWHLWEIDLRFATGLLPGRQLLPICTRPPLLTRRRPVHRVVKQNGGGVFL